GPITSGFCERRSYEACHPGIDIAVPTGTPIHAAASGRVAIAGWVGGYGNYTCIQHSASLSSCYGHQSSIQVSVGQSVSQGEVVGSLFSGAGLVWYGGAIGGAIAVLLWAWRRNWLTLQLLDVASVPLAAGYAIGRIGCQLAGDGDYGKAWDGPWAMAYPHGTVPTTVPVHPTPVYETIVMGLVTVLLWRWRHRFRPGTLFALWALLAGVERFLVEFIRRNEAVVAGLTQPQLISIAMIVGGAAWIAAHGGLQPASSAPKRAEVAARRA